ncbi:hypothetical protein EBH_0025810 [Eimeria brunetti]|uniref:Uncharacterized protein n=1 Tax=Eimeria brunetti TaxID=51314 RepID=U6LG74_9EIME|nr:hypothetical protein EBH_0025810 [Eimeria brunetti]
MPYRLGPITRLHHAEAWDDTFGDDYPQTQGIKSNKSFEEVVEKFSSGLAEKQEPSEHIHKDLVHSRISYDMVKRVLRHDFAPRVEIREHLRREELEVQTEILQNLKEAKSITTIPSLAEPAMIVGKMDDGYGKQQYRMAINY